jgi:hypothetical protein
MNVHMTAERFAALAQAYGGDLRRWPEAERAAANAFLIAEPAAAEPLLAAERWMDGALDSTPQPYPSQALRERVLAAARRPAGPFAGWSLGWSRGRDIRWLAPGAGLAAACIAGAWLGMTASHNVSSQLRADTVLVASADQSAGDPLDPGAL